MVHQPSERNRTNDRHLFQAHSGTCVFLFDKASMDKFSEYFVSVLPTNESTNHPTPTNEKTPINQPTDQ